MTIIYTMHAIFRPARQNLVPCILKHLIYRSVLKLAKVELQSHRKVLRKLSKFALRNVLRGNVDAFDTNRMLGTHFLSIRCRSMMQKRGHTAIIEIAVI